MSIKLYGNYIAALIFKNNAYPSIITTTSKASAKEFSNVEVAKYVQLLKDQGYSPSISAL